LSREDLCPAAQDHSGPDLQMNKLLWCGGLEGEQLNSWAQSMCFVAWSLGLLSVTSPLQQEHLSSATGPSARG